MNFEIRYIKITINKTTISKLLLLA